MKEINKDKRKCDKCNTTIEVSKYYYGSLCRNCFSDKFWEEVLDDNAIIINNQCYHYSKMQSDGGILYPSAINAVGIQHLKTGRVTSISNLRYNGLIPKKYNMEDTHKFVDRY